MFSAFQGGELGESLPREEHGGRRAATPCGDDNRVVHWHLVDDES
jgi:hypothetical protein